MLENCSCIAQSDEHKRLLEDGWKPYAAEVCLVFNWEETGWRVDSSNVVVHLDKDNLAPVRK